MYGSHSFRSKAPASPTSRISSSKMSTEPGVARRKVSNAHARVRVRTWHTCACVHAASGGQSQIFREMGAGKVTGRDVRAALALAVGQLAGHKELHTRTAARQTREHAPVQARQARTQTSSTHRAARRGVLSPATCPPPSSAAWPRSILAPLDSERMLRAGPACTTNRTPCH